jgi:hypothetical protein
MMITQASASGHTQLVMLPAPPVAQLRRASAGERRDLQVDFKFASATIQLELQSSSCHWQPE